MNPPAGMATETFSRAVRAPRSLTKRTVAASRRTAGSAGPSVGYPILGRAAAVAWRIDSVITSFTFGAGPLNWPSSS